jgi:hypothetical protein
MVVVRDLVNSRISLEFMPRSQVEPGIAMPEALPQIYRRPSRQMLSVGSCAGESSDWLLVELALVVSNLR